MAKRVKEPQPDSEIVKVVDPLFDAPVDVEPIHDSSPLPSGPTLRQRVRRVFEFLLRLISWAIILGVIGGGLYFGLPLLYQRFVVPVEQNTAQVGELQSRQKQTAQQLAELQDKLKTLESAQSQNAQSLSQLDKRVSEIETEINGHTKSLAALDKMQSELRAQNESTSAELEHQIKLLKSMELLSRARLYMYQSNFGLAKQDVLLARDLLATVQPDAADTLARNLDGVLRRLDLVLSSLPNFPVAASDDLDIAWQILLSGLPETPTAVAETPIPEITASPTLVAPLTPTSQTAVTPTAVP